jgi:hypothetical protein
MLILLAKILSVGVKPHFTQEIIEKTKLVNGISFIGVPISLFYAILFLFTKYFYFSFVFSVGAVLFGITLFFTSWLGHRFSRNYVSVVAPLLFGFVNVITGKDAGFYLAFIVTTLPALIIFDTNKQSTFYIVLSFLIVTASVVCQMYVKPLYTISYSMMLMVINFSTVLMATLTVIYLYKKELKNSKEIIVEKQAEILDSIRYTKRIQKASLPTEKYIKKSLTKNE